MPLDNALPCAELVENALPWAGLVDIAMRRAGFGLCPGPARALLARGLRSARPRSLLGPCPLTKMPRSCAAPVRRQQFQDLRGTSVDNLMYIKEDLIIPHFYSFYDFIINKVRRHVVRHVARKVQWPPT